MTVADRPSAALSRYARNQTLTLVLRAVLVEPEAPTLALVQ